MIDQVTNLEDGDIALPTASLDLSTRMRDLRARQGLKQSEVARRMRLDPSIPSLWEQGKRLVPANRVRALAEALEVSVEELLDGVSGAQRARRRPSRVPGPIPPVAASSRSWSTSAPCARSQADAGPLLRLLPQIEDEPSVQEERAGRATTAEQWVVPERPPLDGWIPDGWQPADRIQDISPSLPDGYWLDPMKLEKRNARQLAAQSPVRGGPVGGRRARRAGCRAGRAAVSPLQQGGRLRPQARLPLAETIFRCVVAADHGGLTDGALVEMLRERSSACRSRRPCCAACAIRYGRIRSAASTPTCSEGADSPPALARRPGAATRPSTR